VTAAVRYGSAGGTGTAVRYGSCGAGTDASVVSALIVNLMGLTTAALDWERGTAPERIGRAALLCRLRTKLCE
jgi:hypothetical protein